MTVKSIKDHFIIDEAFRWPSCAYCDNEGLPFWDEHLSSSYLWLCRYHRELQEAGWLDLVNLVEEATSGQ